MISADIFEYLNELNALSPANYLASLINDGETEAAGINYLFSDMNSFLIFESVRFSDEARAQYIKNVQDFWNVVSRYIDVTGLHGGDVFVDVPDMTLTRQLLSRRFLWTVPMLKLFYNPHAKSY